MKINIDYTCIYNMNAIARRLCVARVSSIVSLACRSHVALSGRSCVAPAVAPMCRCVAHVLQRPSYLSFNMCSLVCRVLGRCRCVGMSVCCACVARMCRAHVSRAWSHLYVGVSLMCCARFSALADRALARLYLFICVIIFLPCI